MRSVRERSGATSAAEEAAESALLERLKELVALTDLAIELNRPIIAAGSRWRQLVPPVAASQRALTKKKTPD